MHIHWHEGLFLRPQHFQRLQQGFHQLLHEQRRLIAPYPYGVIDARIATDALADFRLHFDSLRVLLPGGQEVRVPENADLPDLQLKQLLAASPNGATVHLALPVWHDKRANTLEQSPTADVRTKVTYRVRTDEIVDENTGNNPQPVLTRRLNCRLVHDQDDLSDLETVPIARVLPGAGATVGHPRIDPEYIAPALFVHGSARLFELIRNLADQVQASHKELIGQINRASFSLETMHGLQFVQVLRLRTLSRFASRLPAMVRASHITPFAWYLELRELLGELQALKLGQESFEVADYDHDNLYPIFKEISDKARALLSTTVTTAFTKVEFRKEPHYYAASLTEEQVTRPVDYLLAIRTAQDYSAVRALVQDGNRFKFLPKSTATSVAQVRGVPLVEEKFPPHFLPNHPGLHYFRLVRGDKEKEPDKWNKWVHIQNEREVCIKSFEHAESDFQITLYLVLPG
ncbi:MAG TPA: type VI secretion system baseplate subunit TssK [Opitutaceae bacterium]